jgi:CspA family cold shock protein
MGESAEKEGVVKEFDAQRGLGVILTRDGEELSVHHSAIEDEGLRTLHPGDIVSFAVGRNKFGRRCAVQVRRIGWEDAESDEPREWSF